MKAYISYTLLDIIEVDFDGTPEEFEEVLYADAEKIGETIHKAVGLYPNDINVDIIE